MITTPKMLGLLAVAFVAGSFVASPELRAYAAATIGSAEIIDNSIQSVDIKDAEVKTADLAGNAVTAAKIKDGEVKAAEIATDAVGASELQGVTKLVFGQCSTSERSGTGVGPGASTVISCAISGADSDDSVMATLNYDGLCFGVEQAYVKSSGLIWVNVKNDCSISQNFPAASSMAVIVYDK